MKNSFCIFRFTLLFVLLICILALCSWIGSIYDVGEVQSLLGTEGVRWILGHVAEDYVKEPALRNVMILLMGVGIAVRSGLSGTLRKVCQKGKKLSRKERRALSLSSISFFIYWSFVVVGLLLPWNLLLGVTGSLLHSPFMKGLVFVLSLSAGLAGMVYGYVIGAFRSVLDVMKSMSFLLSSVASYFVSLFFIVLFFSALDYSYLVEWLGISDNLVLWIRQFCCYSPLLFYLLKTK